MAKFRFGLQAVLKYRGILEDEAKREFAEAKRHVDEAQDLIKAMYARADEVRQEISDAQRKGSAMAMDLVRASEHFLIGHARRIQIARQGLSQLLTTLEDKQELLMVAAREKKVLTKLREKRRVEFIAHLDKLEAVELDEMATIRRGWGKR